MTTDLLKQLATTLKAEYRQTPASHQGYHATCPKCGKPAKRGQKHFFFSERGFKCWTCGDGWHGSLRTLANFVGLDTGDYKPPDYQRDTIPVQASEFPYSLIERYERHPKRIQLWQQYKPIPEELIIRYRLGVGRLPDLKGGFMKEERLIIPIIRDDKLAMLRGRSPNPNCDPHWKWITRGSPAQLFNINLITRHSLVLVLENWIDALLAMILRPEFTPVAGSGGAGTWLKEWSQAIAQIKPVSVLFAMDNDEAGRAGNINAANSLLAAGYKGIVKFHEYDKNTPYKSSLIDCIGGM